MPPKNPAPLDRLAERLREIDTPRYRAAEALGISSAHFSDILRGKEQASVEVCVKIERLYGVELPALQRMRSLVAPQSEAAA